MIEHTMHIMCNIVLINFMIHGVFIRNSNITHCWNCFESVHGKGENDGAGACVKRALRRYPMNSHANRFESADKVVEWCKIALSHENNSSRCA
jgi:hypothetical protein